MPANVYLVNFRARNPKSNIPNKIQKLLSLDAFKNIFLEKELTAVKVHFGEKGNEAYVNPVYVRQCVDFLKSLGTKPFITDTNTMYVGSRANAVDHLQTAIEHGFAYAVVNAPLIIADGLKSRDFEEVEINKKHFKTVKIAQNILDADSMLVVSHFKGHEMSGFGGAIKNLAMGGAPVAGKMEQHSARPDIGAKRCNGCGLCVRTCKWHAYELKNKISTINKALCVGCGECLAICPQGAIYLDWETDISEFLERLTEHAYGTVLNKPKKVVYLNFLKNISPECDCYPWHDAPIAQDIGILASTDPVAIDKASYDLVNKAASFQSSVLPAEYQEGQDKFKAIHPHVDSLIQIKYGQELKLGQADYKLIEV